MIFRTVRADSDNPLLSILARLQTINLNEMLDYTSKYDKQNYPFKDFLLMDKFTNCFFEFV